ncbi:bifunctional adenosylcobinamide kinase/adenosylcobinamide-phosphate guanylyltransferase [Desulfofalx alkaliphila]|uniref:bifunctional adenosylcobinamide kinase/adenosylcobinamide-phosphate guanylyltransferase n=1 Tax=Desulfofalx alkaliphila TaxID=105483 RepID=UPI0004E0EF51|nr:bifunctional adenosylcobinamide kinase/adenosylcobinamide-phosphate guanylyltransferase [Desulfofalx alkaliphila]
MGKDNLIVVIGGARSGKSKFAENLAAGLGKNVTYIATAAVVDSEMANKIAQLKSRRPKHWHTIEETLEIVDIVGELGQKADVILVDCLTVWLSNLLLNSTSAGPSLSWPKKESYILNEVERLSRTAKECQATVIIVTNEISLGLLPDNKLGRAFRDVTGAANQIIARYADKVYLTVAGIPVELKSLTHR